MRSWFGRSQRLLRSVCCPESVLQHCQQRPRIYISTGKNYIRFIPKAWAKEFLQAGEEWVEPWTSTKRMMLFQFNPARPSTGPGPASGGAPVAGHHPAPRPPRSGCRNPCSKSCDPCPSGVSIPSGKLRRRPPPSARPPEGDAKPAPPARRRPQGRGANPRLRRDARYRRYSFPGCQPPWLGTCR
jgi:hypothetical protein